METTTFFPGANRRVILGSPTLLIGSNKTRKLRLPIHMPLTGEKLVGMPDWLGDAYAAVSKSFTEVAPPIQQIADVVLHFSNDAPKGELFEPPQAKAPGSELRKFTVVRVGDGENPTVELQFTAYIPFSRDFWRWIGEMAGEEVHLAFPSSIGGTVAVKAQTEPLPDPGAMNDDGFGNGDDDDEDSDPELTAIATGEMPEPPTLEEELGPEFEDQVRQSMGAPEPFSNKPRLVDARPAQRKKSGPAELKAYHEKQSAIESKAKRGARKSLSVN
jgi:hypothetical protein